MHTCSILAKSELTYNRKIKEEEIGERKNRKG